MYFASKITIVAAQCLLVSESRRLHDAKVSLENALRLVNLGESQYWYRAANNVPDAVRQVYLEIEGKLK